ncbi:tyrosine-type recombinase/integrase [Rosenbergiella collisarenosi]|uniref:tyrosine-type recombinase/integrase n=1 Tax=Rosenbergiella collisarenosi TaxID=1544695 RepID=UPI001BDB240C|nr:tyrosine-type recombinase/integrase [Rosenbergiella collisarenosi]MBT0722445.1 tyrosine-type recombinase/integrase [Rosenbergiella collisarenosi]
MPAHLAHITAEDVAHNLRNFLRDNEGYAPNTLASLMSGTKLYANWCISKGYTWLPVNPDNCREYLIWMKNVKGNSINTVRSRLSMLNMLMKVSGLPGVSMESVVSLGMKKLNRIAATNGERVGQAVPFYLADLQVADYLYKQLGTLTAMRNRAFLYVAYNTMLRISEIARLRVRDVQIKGDSVTLFIAYTKTNTLTETIKQLSKKTVNALFEWLKISGLEHHPDAMIFSQVFKNGKVRVAEKSLSNVAIEKIYKDTWELMGREDEPKNKGRYSQWSGHSCRVGATLDLSMSGATLPQIMAEGGWKNTETAMRYMRNTGSVISAVTKMMD